MDINTHPLKAFARFLCRARCLPVLIFVPYRDVMPGVAPGQSAGIRTEIRLFRLMAEISGRMDGIGFG